MGPGSAVQYISTPECVVSGGRIEGGFHSSTVRTAGRSCGWSQLQLAAVAVGRSCSWPVAVGHSCSWSHLQLVTVAVGPIATAVAVGHVCGQLPLVSCSWPQLPLVSCSWSQLQLVAVAVGQLQLVAVAVGQLQLVLLQLI